MKLRIVINLVVFVVWSYSWFFVGHYRLQTIGLGLLNSYLFCVWFPKPQYKEHNS